MVFIPHRVCPLSFLPELVEIETVAGEKPCASSSIVAEFPYSVKLHFTCDWRVSLLPVNGYSADLTRPQLHHFEVFRLLFPF